MYQPDALASYKTHGGEFLVFANEGDARDYEGYSEEERVKDLTLDPTAYPDAATLQDEDVLGRLKTTTATGDSDGDGDIDQIFSYGARSFSIWSTDGRMVFDSGDELEQITAAAYPDDFNSDNEENDSFDKRSDDKGPEPEGVVVAKLWGRQYAFIGLERMGGVVAYDVTDPENPEFIEYFNNRDYSVDTDDIADGLAPAGSAGDLGPEGLIVIPEHASPNGMPLLVVGNEVSGTTTIIQINRIAAKGGSEYASGRDETTPNGFVLNQNHPNPFNPSTAITFEVPEAANVRLEVFDMLGRRVAQLVNGVVEAGSHTAFFDAQSLPSGTYIYRLATPSGTHTRKLLLLK
jgi:hypothetical protein